MIRQYLKDDSVQDFIIDLNLETLYQKGERADGVNLGEYTAYTKVIKRFKGQPTDRVTLKDEGDFYESFFLKIGNNQFEIDATDEKKDKLMDKYGDEILGINQEGLQEIREDLLEYLRPILLKYLLS